MKDNEILFIFLTTSVLFAIALKNPWYFGAILGALISLDIIANRYK